MKRLAVAFQRREQPVSPDDQGVYKKRSGFFFKRSPSELQVPHNASSSSSSDGSVVQTPDPEDEPGARARPTARWASWIRPKPSKAKTLHVAGIWDAGSIGSRPTRLPVVQPPSTNLDSDDDESDHYDDDEEPLTPPVMTSPSRPSHSPARSSRMLPRAKLLHSQMNFRAITFSSLILPLSPPPFLHLPSTPLFPRSSNPTRALKRLQTTHTVLHKTVLVRRLENQALTRSENESIVAFGNRPKHIVPKARRQGIDEEAMSDVKKVRHYSRGLQAWLARPCFEERCVLWCWDTEGREVIARSIVGSGKAVASLEFSEGIEALAGYDLEPFPSLSAPASFVHPKSTPFLPPLHITSPSLQVEAVSPGSSTPNASTGPSTPTNVVPLSATPRKILRFLPDPDPEDEVDNVPLGYQVLSNKERERQAEERVHAAREEERMKKVYAEEVAAARARREGSRSGSMHETERDKAKDRRSSYVRPAYDPAQLGSRVSSAPDTRPRPHSLSRPPSVTDVNGNAGAKSRPSSIRGTRPHSTTDVHAAAKTRPSSIRSDWTGPGPSSLRTPPLPPHPQARQSAEDLKEEKRRRRASNLSEGAASTRSRAPSAPSVSARASMQTHTLPRAHSSGPGMSGMSMMPVPAPPMPVPALPMPVFPVMPGAPQFFMQPPMPQAHLHALHGPLMPPIRPGLPVSRSTEGLLPSSSRHSGRQEFNMRSSPSPRRESTREDVKRASRTSVQVPPVSFMQTAPQHTGSTRTSRLSR